jgi:hypothetical protein|tara:strand:+ start:1142 stop:1246 length:105 start_codon:yes stop_codon:yes gene_type:complete
MGNFWKSGHFESIRSGIFTNRWLVETLTELSASL